jgi:hypothetical protein
MKTALLALGLAAVSPAAFAQDRGDWRIELERPAAVLRGELRGEPGGVLRILCDRATQKLTITVSSEVRVRKGDRPKREVFVTFDSSKETETWLWSYRDRTTTLTRDYAVEPFLQKLTTAKKLAITAVAHTKERVNLYFAPAGAAQALSDLRAACSAPTPSMR